MMVNYSPTPIDVNVKNINSTSLVLKPFANLFLLFNQFDNSSTKQKK